MEVQVKKWPVYFLSIVPTEILHLNSCFLMQTHEFHVMRLPKKAFRLYQPIKDSSPQQLHLAFTLQLGLRSSLAMIVTCSAVAFCSPLTLILLYISPQVPYNFLTDYNMLGYLQTTSPIYYKGLITCTLGFIWLLCCHCPLSGFTHSHLSHSEGTSWVCLTRLVFVSLINSHQSSCPALAWRWRHIYC